jgi:hypothetical protein
MRDGDPCGGHYRATASRASGDLGRRQKMTLTDAAERINRHPDLTATVLHGRIMVDVYHRPAGSVSEGDLAQLGHTPTGWGRNLSKRKLAVWHSLTGK